MTKRKAFPTKEEIIEWAEEEIEEWLASYEDSRALAERMYQLFRGYQ